MRLGSVLGQVGVQSVVRQNFQALPPSQVWT